MRVLSLQLDGIHHMSAAGIRAAGALRQPAAAQSGYAINWRICGAFWPSTGQFGPSGNATSYFTFPINHGIFDSSLPPRHPPIVAVEGLSIFAAIRFSDPDVSRAGTVTPRLRPPAKSPPAPQPVTDEVHGGQRRPFVLPEPGLDLPSRATDRNRQRLARPDSVSSFRRQECRQAKMIRGLTRRRPSRAPHPPGPACTTTYARCWRRRSSLRRIRSPCS